jgi:hypothetical protein
MDFKHTEEEHVMENQIKEQTIGMRVDEGDE